MATDGDHVGEQSGTLEMILEGKLSETPLQMIVLWRKVLVVPIAASVFIAPAEPNDDVQI